jgi:hypothetical protein
MSPSAASVPPSQDRRAPGARKAIIARLLTGGSNTAFEPASATFSVVDEPRRTTDGKWIDLP